LSTVLQELDAGNLESIAREAAQTTGSPFCVISLASGAPETFSSQEHFVPEGLGFPWTKLPRGVGTCDRVNQEFSRYEEEWMRYGLLGALRPFYVAMGKNDPPAFYAPTRAAASLEMVQDRDQLFQILITTPEVQSLPPLVEGPGTLELKYEAGEANPTFVSLAVHKVAILALLLTNPALAGSAALDSIRSFLTNPSETTFRPVWQAFAAGVEPGVNFAFEYELAAQELPTAGARNPAKLLRLAVTIRVHHVLYWLVLVGEPAPPPGEPSWEMKEWQPLDSKARRNFALRFAFDAVIEESKE
jgi:hypothetical protein